MPKGRRYSNINCHNKTNQRVWIKSSTIGTVHDIMSSITTWTVTCNAICLYYFAISAQASMLMSAASGSYSPFGSSTSRPGPSVIRQSPHTCASQSTTVCARTRNVSLYFLPYSPATTVLIGPSPRNGVSKMPYQFSPAEHYYIL